MSFLTTFCKCLNEFIGKGSNFSSGKNCLKLLQENRVRMIANYKDMPDQIILPAILEPECRKLIVRVFKDCLLYLHIGSARSFLGWKLPNINKETLFVF